MEGDLIQHHWFLVGRGGDSRDVTAQRKDREVCRLKERAEGSQTCLCLGLGCPASRTVEATQPGPSHFLTFLHVLLAVSHTSDTAKQKEKKWLSFTVR